MSFVYIGSDGVRQSVPASVDGSGNVNMNLSTLLTGENKFIGGLAVYNAGNQYITVAASQSAQVLQTLAGAAGDYIEGLWVVPSATTWGAVSIQDGTGSAITLAAGETTGSQRPFWIPIGARSINGAWKVTTGVAVSVIAYGVFS